MSVTRIGIIGFGFIGFELAKVIDKSKEMELTAVAEKNTSQIKKIEHLKHKPAIVSINDVIERSDLIIEAAHPDAVKEILLKAIEKKKALMIMSTGGLVGNEELLDRAEKNNIKIYLPSGAICGLDGIKAISNAKIEKITLTTTKPPKGLEGAPFILENKIDLEIIKKKTKLFEGSVEEAVKAFPTNINVCATLALAGDRKKTTIQIYADPNATKNIHEIKAEGDFGITTTKTENMPSPQNPKTSYLALLSAIETLKQIRRNVRIGT